MMMIDEAEKGMDDTCQQPIKRSCPLLPGRRDLVELPRGRQAGEIGVAWMSNGCAEFM